MFSWFGKVKKTEYSREEILNAGLNLAMEFGENWLQPIQERLSKKYPHLSAEDLVEYNTLCKSAMNFGHEIVYELAEQHGKETKYEKFEPIYIQKYSWVSRKNLSRLFSQGMYYAWRDMGF